MNYEAFGFVFPLIFGVLVVSLAIVILGRRRAGASKVDGLPSRGPFPIFAGRNHKPATAMIAGITAVLLTAAGHAATDARFVLAAYSNVDGGREILSGDYKAALTALDARGRGDGAETAYLSLNRCAALTMTKQWAVAQAACDKAVHDARLNKISDGGGSLEELHLLNEKVALAYSDRAVLEWLTNNRKAAAQDMAQAKSVFPQSELVAQNFAALAMRSPVVNVRSAEQR